MLVLGFICAHFFDVFAYHPFGSKPTLKEILNPFAGFSSFGGFTGAVIGLLLVSVLTDILIMLGVSTPAQGLAQGLMIAIAVGVDIQLRKRAGA